MSKILENKYMKIVKEENILACFFAQNLELDLETAKIIVNERVKFSNGTSYPALIDMTGVKSASKEAREYMGKEGAHLLTAGALLIHSPLTKILGNLFLSLNKPGIPTKLFTGEAEAREWLQQYKIVNKTSI